MSQFFEIHPDDPQPRLIKQAAQIIRDGGIVVVPTDSSYAIACQLDDKGALERIRRIRALDKKHNFTLLCRDLSEIATYVRVDNPAYRLLKARTPGPYTFVLRATAIVPRRLQHPKRKTIGIRVPDHKICLELVKGLGNPIITTSATMPDGSIVNDASLIHDVFRNRIDLVIDGDIAPGLPSSVISLIDDVPEVIRKGAGDVSIFE